MQVMQQQQPAVDWLTVAEVSSRLINLGKGGYYRHINKEEETCAICLIPYLDAALTLTPCKHVFHQHCFQTMVQQHLYTCPLCRFNLKPVLEKVHLLPPQPAQEPDRRHWLYILANDDDLSFDDLLQLLIILQRQQLHVFAVAPAQQENSDENSDEEDIPLAF